jgi:hypothetical protein
MNSAGIDDDIAYLSTMTEKVMENQDRSGLASNKKAKNPRSTRGKKGRPQKEDFSATQIKNAYFPEFSAEIERAVISTINNYFPPLALDGPTGCGKTSTVTRVCKEKKCQLITINASMDLSTDTMLQDRLIALTRRKNKRKTVIFLDELEYARLPRRSFKVKRKSDGKITSMNFLQFLIYNIRKSGVRNNVTVIATMNDGWKLLKNTWFKDLFSVHKVTVPTSYKIRQAYKRKFGLILPKYIPPDLRQANFVARDVRNGLEMPPSYKHRPNSFELFREYIGKSPRERRKEKKPDLRPGVEKWLVANLFAQDMRAAFRSNEKEFYEIIDLLSIADAAKDDDVISVIPARELGFFVKIEHPTTILSRSNTGA